LTRGADSDIALFGLFRACDAMSEADEQPVRISFLPDADAAEWTVAGLSLSERFNQPYELRLELRTTNLGAEPALLLGVSATVMIERGNLSREICGIIESVEDGLSDQDHMIAVVTIVPALMGLGQRKTSRIFQEMTIPEILEAVLDEGLGPYERSVDIGFLSGSYTAQEYTVQYQETDLDFVERLMEEYGITYKFKHEDGAEILVLLDSDSAYADVTSLGNMDGVLPMVLRDGSSGRREDIRSFHRESKLRPTAARTMVFDWLAPDSLQTAENVEEAELDPPNGAIIEPEREIYEHEAPTTTYGYRTAGLDFAAVEQQTKLRRKVQQRDAVRCFGTSTVTSLTLGHKFELLDHPQADLDGQYLVIAVDHGAGSLSTTSVTGEDYTNRFECIPLAVEWRPARRWPKPRITSVQTATVVGPAGEEIYTDEHGRIKVQFHWDRDGAFDENTTCFIRVVQPWAGNGWGFVFLPRIGMEVAVTFIDGDPDRPVVTGCLYNGANPPPYPLPDDKTKSTIKSESSPGGGGFNELRFEDAAGSEEIYIHAQKDFNEEVLNDHNTTVGNNQTNNVDVDQTQTVHGNQSETVDGNQDMEVGGNRTVHVIGDFEETVDGTETRTVTGDVTETFAANETRTISADQTETISGSVTHTISGDQTDTITGSLSQTITAGVTVTTPATYDLTAVGGVTVTAAAGMKVVAPGGFTVLAPGGTKTVDQDFWSFGGGQGAIFGWAIGITGLKTEYTGIAMGWTDLKIEHSTITIATGTVQLKTEVTELDTVSQCLQFGAIHTAAYGLISML
jgi:type VI secretion system secreted protein VgrG